MFVDINRSMSAVEVRFGDKLLGLANNMSLARSLIPTELQGKVSYQFIEVNEKRNPELFWNLLRKGIVKQR